MKNNYIVSAQHHVQSLRVHECEHEQQVGMDVSILKYQYINTDVSIKSIDTQIKMIDNKACFIYQWFCLLYNVYWIGWIIYVGK